MLSAPATARPALLALRIGAEPEAWRRCGFSVGDSGLLRAGGILIVLDPQSGTGLSAWQTTTAIPGLRSFSAPPAADAPAVHPNAVTGVDHVVIATGAIDETTAAFVEAGCEVRAERRAELGGTDVLQRFLPMGGALAELVEPQPPTGSGPAFWGITFVCSDLGSLPSLVGEPRPAVQRGRRIAVARSEAGLGTRAAFMSPR